jgi:hypothetical protein
LVELVLTATGWFIIAMTVFIIWWTAGPFERQMGIRWWVRAIATGQGHPNRQIVESQTKVVRDAKLCPVGIINNEVNCPQIVTLALSL